MLYFQYRKKDIFQKDTFMTKEITNKLKTGIVFGTFAPMHTGHVDLIQRAKRENDNVIVIVSGTNTQRDRGTQIGLRLDRRFRYVREVFRDEPLISIEKLDEEDMPEYPNGWDVWLDALNSIITKTALHSYDQLTFYVGEEEYCEPLAAYFNELISTKIVLVERSSIPISATKIRQEPLKFWRYITKPFRRHFTKKVLVIGAASGGKTTLVKDLGRAFNAPVSLEYAREYQLKYNVRDYELDVQDYIRLLVDQYSQTSDIIDAGSHSGVIFADTNSAVTMGYIEHYLRETISEDDYQMLSNLFHSTLLREQWDLILLISPQSKYVDDGFRDMTMSEQSIRDKFTTSLINFMKPFEDKMVILRSDNPETFFIDNYTKAKQLIAERLNIEI